MTARLRRLDGRLVTIVGRSGVGKTRLSVEVASRAQGAWPGAAVFIDLARTADAALVAGVVAGAIGTRVAAGQSAEDAVRAWLRHAPTLLVVDEIDRAPGAADVLLDLVAQSSDSRILATAQRAIPGHAGAVRPLVEAQVVVILQEAGDQFVDEQ